MSRGELDALERQFKARDPDARLMLQVRDDVPGAFEAVVARYQDRLVGVLFHVVGDFEEAEDLSQDVFLRVYRTRKAYRPRAKFSTWLFTIANNLAINHARGKARKPLKTVGPVVESGGSMDEAPVLSVPSREGTASAQMRKVELSEAVHEALRGLNEDQKMAVLLSKFEGMSYAEIGAVMSRSTAAIKSLLSRARNQLREQLEPCLALESPPTRSAGE